MESLPEDPRSGKTGPTAPGRPSTLGNWLIRPGSMILAMIGLFLVFSGSTAFLAYRHLETTRENFLNSDKTTANLLATFLAEHEKFVTGLLRSYAARPLFISAIKTRNVPNAHWHLADLKKNHEIDLMFVTDPRGVLWLNYPIFPEVIGKDLSDSDWYRGISAHWNPYVSEVYQLIVAGGPLAVTVCVPITDEKGKVIGILGNSHRLAFLDDTIEQVAFSPDTAVTIVDRKGQILYSNRYGYRGKITVYPHLSTIKQALGERRRQIEDAPDQNSGKLYLSVSPVAGIDWTVVVERRRGDLYRSQFRRLAEIGGAGLLLFVLTSLFLAYLRRFALYRKTGELLAAQRDALEKERRYRSLLETVHMIAVGLDAEGIVTFANPFLLELTGYSAAEILGENWFDRFLPEEEKEAVKQVFHDLRGDSVISHYENRILTRAGRERLIAWDNTVLQDPQGRFAGTMSLGVDITEISQTLEALRESEERFRKAFHTSPDAININRLEDGMYVDANEGFLALMGFTREDVIGKTSLELNIWVDPADRKRLVDGLKQSGQVSNLEARFRMNDGTTVTGLMSATVLMLKGVPHIISITRNIEEIKKVQDSLRESEEKYRGLFEGALEGIYQSTPEGRLLSANPAMARIYGYDSAEELIESVTDMASQIYAHPDDRAEILRIVTAEGILSDHEVQHRRKDGSTVWLSLHARTVRDESGKVIRLEGMAVDITERKRTEQALSNSERNYRNLFENATEGIFQSTPDGRYVSVNPAFARIGGYNSPDEMISDVTDIQKKMYVHPEDRARLLELLNKQDIINNFEAEIRRKDNTIIWISMNVRAIRDQAGKITLLEGTIHDITERKQAEEEIQKLNAELEQRVIERTAQLEAANRELESFSYSVSHDLRAPLRGIDGFSQALLEDYRERLDETGRDYLDRVRRAAQKMGFLIDDILKLSRVTRYKLNREPVDLSQMVRILVEMYKKSEPGRVVDGVVQDGCVVQGDPDLLEIALRNLIDNAWKFTSGTPRGRIEFGSFDERGKTVYFMRDNGVGFDMTYVDKLFGAFQRLHRSDEFPGTGIGLATVKRIISRHEGWIRADGKIGEGATFFFTLA
jgi:PAS domain S-box-containing protein